LRISKKKGRKSEEYMCGTKKGDYFINFSLPQRGGSIRIRTLSPPRSHLQEMPFPVLQLYPFLKKQREGKATKSTFARIEPSSLKLFKIGRNPMAISTHFCIKVPNSIRSTHQLCGPKESHTTRRWSKATLKTYL